MPRDRERSRSRDRYSRRSHSPHRSGGSSSHSRRRDSERDHHHHRRDHERSKRPRRSEDLDKWDEKGANASGKARRHSHSERKRANATPSDDDDLLDIRKMGIRPISEEDYFAKSAEFKYWLSDDRDKDFHDMTSDQTHRYFRKFVRRWNDGALREKYYNEPPRSPNTSISRWGTDQDVRRALPAIEDDDRSPSPGPRLEPGPSHRGGTSQIGPTLPSASDRRMAMEAQREAELAARKAERSATRRTALERAEEVAPRLQGKEGKMAEKRATNSANKEMREKEVGGLELDEKTLMGEESSFQAALRARDAAAARRRDKKDAEMVNLRSANEERLAERRQKESETMQMLHAMARQRYG